MKINGNTRILGVLGYPVKHTLSPPIHNFLIEKYKLNLIYLPFEVSKNNFEKFIKGISHIDNLSGFNITVPYKVDVIKHLYRISSEAVTINAVNTVKIKKNKMYGFNSDYFGFKRSIELNFPKFKFRGKRVLMLGAGGASKAVALSLLKSSIRELVILNRTYKNAVRLKSELQKGLNDPNITVFRMDFEYLKKSELLPDLIVNTTSVGLKKTDKTLIDLKYLKQRNTIIYDLIYNPSRTKFLKSASSYGLPVLNGLDMLILQALKSFSIWTGISLEEELMRSVNPLRENLKKILKSQGV